MLRFITGVLVLALTAPALADQPDYEPTTPDYSPKTTTGFWSVISERVEVEGKIRRIDFGGIADRAPVGGAAWYAVSKTLDLGMTANLEKDVRGYGIAVRFHFGK